MKIFINNQEVQTELLFPLSWAKLVQELLKTAIPANHGIVRVVIDGQENFKVISEEADKPVPETISTLEIFTKDFKTITSDGFLKAFGLLNQLKNEILKSADLFRNGELENAAYKLTAIMDAFKPLIQFIDAIAQSYQLNYEKIPFDQETSIAAKIENFSETLKVIIDAQEKQDYIELADTLEYQFAGQMELWQQILQKILDQINS